MRRSIAVLAGVLGAALLLSACDFGGGPPTPPRTPDYFRTATEDFDTPVVTLDIPAFEERLVEIRVPSSLVGDALYIELEGAHYLGVYDANRFLVATSRSASFFGRGNEGLAPAGLEANEGLAPAGLEAQAINVPIRCRGSCVILDAPAHSTVYARVRNNSTSQVSVPLYAYTDIFQDTNEPRNNRPDTAPELVIAAGLAEGGAIERVGDYDFWNVRQSGYVSFVAENPSVQLRAGLFNGQGQLLGESFLPGNRIFLMDGEIFGVWALSGRAAASFDSNYELHYGD